MNENEVEEVSPEEFTKLYMSMTTEQRELSDNFKLEAARMEWQRCYRDFNGDLGALTNFCEKLGWDFNVK